MNTRLFEAQMTLRGETQESVALVIGKRRETAGHKIRNGTFTQREIKKIIEAWGLSPKEATNIFFKE